jgi:DMSO reductase anchor subunit
MIAKYILATLAVLFALLTVIRMIKDRGFGPGSRSWLLIAVIFGIVSAWLFFGVHS